MTEVIKLFKRFDNWLEVNGSRISYGYFYFGLIVVLLCIVGLLTGFIK